MSSPECVPEPDPADFAVALQELEDAEAERLDPAHGFLSPYELAVVRAAGSSPISDAYLPF